MLSVFVGTREGFPDDRRGRLQVLLYTVRLSLGHADATKLQAAVTMCVILLMAAFPLSLASLDTALSRHSGSSIFRVARCIVVSTPHIAKYQKSDPVTSYLPKPYQNRRRISTDYHLAKTP